MDLAPATRWQGAIAMALVALAAVMSSVTPALPKAHAAAQTAAQAAGTSGLLAYYSHWGDPATDRGVTVIRAADARHIRRVEQAQSVAWTRSETDEPTLIYARATNDPYPPWHYFKAHIDGAPQQIGGGFGADGLSISPDNTALLFSGQASPVSNWGVVTQRLDPLTLVAIEQARLLIPGGYNPSWSPDGLRVAFVLDNQIFTAAADGTSVTPVTSNRNVVHRRPSWSPDGSRLAWVECSLVGCDRADSETAVVAVNQTGVRQVLVQRPIGDGISTFAWSPESDAVAYTYFDRSQTAAWRLRVAPLDGGPERDLASNAWPGGALTWTSHTAGSTDVTPPLVTATPDRPPNEDGWYNAPVTIGWSVSDDSGPLPGPAAVTVSTDGAGQVVESALVCDPSGNCARGTTSVSLDRVAPTVTPVVPTPNAAGWHSGPVTVEWRVEDPAPSSGIATTPMTIVAATEGRDVAYVGQGGCDVAGNCATGGVSLSIDSTAPAIGALALGENPKAVSSSTTVSASVSDGLSGVVRGEFFLGPDPGAGNGTSAALVDDRLQATVGTEVPPGVYTLSARVADAAGNWSSLTSNYLVVYDPEGGFVTGSGRIDSRAGAYPADPTVTGSASFGFVSKYQKGATAPTGSTEFQFRAAGFRFTSEQYEWLVVSGARAQYKGSGSVNGQSGYGFLLTVTDGDLTGGDGTDKFRLKVTDASGQVIYDNLVGADDQLDKGQGVAAGSITIQKE